MAGGATAERSLTNNRSSFDRWRLRPRVLTGVMEASTNLSILGCELAFPVLVAPSAAHGLLHPEGELATAAGACAAGAGLILSSGSSFALEEVAAAAPAGRWMQLLLPPANGRSLVTW